MIAAATSQVERHTVGDNVWLSRAGDNAGAVIASLSAQTLSYDVLESEEAVGMAMLEELQLAAREKNGDLTIILLGGRGAQALHRRLGHLAQSDEADQMLNRLNVFTQDALAPMRLDNSFSFVRDFNAC